MSVQKKSDTFNKNVQNVDGDGYKYRVEIVWLNVTIYIITHAITIYGIRELSKVGSAMEFYIIYLIALFGSFGVQAGAHRLWAHKAYKAKLPLRIWLMLWQTLAAQNSLHEWVRDHRAHHKFTDTSADPHDSSRGFFFCHVGWLLCKKHRDVRVKGKCIDMSDIEADPVVMFQKKYYPFIVPIFAFLLPTLGYSYVFNRTLYFSFITAGISRWILSLNLTWLVNSAAHLWGYRPYDKAINPRDKFLTAVITHGEAWHNYHHVFPWDYRASEYGPFFWNPCTWYIDFFALLGLAYDLKSVSRDMVVKRAHRTGDGTWFKNDKGMAKNSEKTGGGREELVWGWDDVDMKEEDKTSMAEIIYRKTG